MKLEQEFVSLSCPTCSIVFCVPELLQKYRVKDGGDIYCPNGHISTWRAAPEISPEQVEIARLKQQIEQLEAALEHSRGSVDGQEMQ